MVFHCNLRISKTAPECAGIQAETVSSNPQALTEIHQRLAGAKYRNESKEEPPSLTSRGFSQSITCAMTARDTTLTNKSPGGSSWRERPPRRSNLFCPLDVQRELVPGAALAILDPGGWSLRAETLRLKTGRAERQKAPKSLLKPETSLPPNFADRINLPTAEGVRWISGDLQPKAS